MEKLNDTMTICTLAKPGMIAVDEREYKSMCRMYQHYDMLVKMITKAIDLDKGGKPDIDYNGRDFILNAFELLEPEAFNYRVRQLKEKAHASVDSDQDSDA